MADKYVELMKVVTADDLAFLKSILSTTDIPYYFEDLNFRAKKGFPAFLAELVAFALSKCSSNILAVPVLSSAYGGLHRHSQKYKKIRLKATNSREN